MYLSKHATNRKVTPQSEPIPGKKMVENSAGGFTFQVDDWTRLERFLILGSEGGSYYATEKELTKDSAKAIERCILLDGVRTVNKIVEISDAGRASKNDPAIFALAMCAKLGSPATRQYANEVLPEVCRIGTHIQHYAEYVQLFGGWGSGTKRAVGRWYNSKAPKDLAYQLIKYQSRDGWSNRDLLRLSHPVPNSPERAGMYHWVTQGKVTEAEGEGMDLIRVVEALKGASVREVCKAIREHQLPREVVPTALLNEVAVWDALLGHMKPEAMIRNLGKMTSVGLLKPLSAPTNFVVGALKNAETMRRSRLHPIKILGALLTYQQGHGVKGSLTWDTVPAIVNALDEAFYGAFKSVEPTNKATLLALDVSGSMTMGQCSGMAGLTPRVGSAAMALITAAVEANHHFVGFTAGLHGRNGVSTLDISPNQRLDSVVRFIDRLAMGGTDCALPMIWAMQNKIPVETFQIYTDSETYAGGIQPVQALRQYRQKMGIDAKLVVVGMLGNQFTIADPADAGMLDVVGFDTNAPSVIADFSR